MEELRKIQGLQFLMSEKPQSYAHTAKWWLRLVTTMLQKALS